jgi:hypothetical protein
VRACFEHSTHKREADATPAAGDENRAVAEREEIREWDVCERRCVV